MVSGLEVCAFLFFLSASGEKASYSLLSVVLVFK